MDDWEEEAETIETTTPILTKEKKLAEDESEEIIKSKVEFKPQPTGPKEDPDDYETKWQTKNKDLIDRRMKEEKAVEGLDELDKQKKLIDMRKINDASDFLEDKPSKKESGKEQVTAPLVTEKDFIDLAVQSVSRIKAANKPSKFTFSYVKTGLDLLGPTLDGDKLDQLIKDLTVLFNKKRKDEATRKKPGQAKPSVSAGKHLDRAEKMGALEDFGAKEEVREEEDFYEDDFI